MEELSTIFGLKFFTIGTPYFINNNCLLFGFADLSATNNFTVSWDITENRIKNMLNFLGVVSSETKDLQLLLCNNGGLVGLSDVNAITVRESKVPTETYIQFYKNQLVYHSDKAFIGQSMIYDTTGKMIANLASQPFVVGKNIIRINQPLQKGVYLLSIKNDTNQFSYKFIVE